MAANNSSNMLQSDVCDEYRIIVLQKTLEKPKPATTKEILSNCQPYSSSIAFRPFLKDKHKKAVFCQSDNDTLPLRARSVMDLLGFPGALIMAFRMHAIVEMAPHDWWNVIVQCIAQQIDSEHHRQLEDSELMQQIQPVDLNVKVDGESVMGWLKSVNTGLSELNSSYKTKITDLLLCNYSTSTEISEILNLTAVACAVKARFGTGGLQNQEYLCGLYGIKMYGSLSDWIKLKKDFNTLVCYLDDGNEEYGIQKPWCEGIEQILTMLIISYEHHGRQNLVKKFWKSMLQSEYCNCSDGSLLHGWCAYLFSCQIIQPVVDLSAVPTNFGMANLPFTAITATRAVNYELWTGVVGYSLEYDAIIGRWFIRPLKECTVFQV